MMITSIEQLVGDQPVVLVGHSTGGFAAQLTQIQAPTLVMTGDCDPIVPLEQSHVIAQKVAQAQLALIKGAGHFPFFECPADYQAKLKAWVGRYAQS